MRHVIGRLFFSSSLWTPSSFPAKPAALDSAVVVVNTEAVRTEKGENRGSETSFGLRTCAGR